MKEQSAIKVYRRRIILEDGRYLIFFTFDDNEDESKNVTEPVDAEQEKVA